MMRTSAFSLALLLVAGCSPDGPNPRDGSVDMDGGVDGGAPDVPVDVPALPDVPDPDARDGGPDGNMGDAGPPPCTEDSECDDGVFCNGAETCAAGECAPGTTPSCDDSIDCTVDVCDDAMNQCRNFPDATLCENAETCGAEGCTSECDVDGDCDDGVFCNGVEVCTAGTCQSGNPPACDDSIACTEDVCDELSSSCRSFPGDAACGVGETCNAATGCIPECAGDAECSDGLYCNGEESCSAGSCVAGTPPSCDDAVACTRDICDEVTDACLVFAEDRACAVGETCDAAAGCTPECVQNSDCDDGDYCSGAESCVGGQCVAGAPIACDDGVACTIDVCDESADTCRAIPEDSRCGGTDTCSPAMGCIPACSDNSDCDDGFFCTGDETCVGGSCQGGTPPPMDDGIACTIEFCNEAMSLATSVPTNSLCEGAGGTCDVTPSCTTVAGCVGADSAGHESYSSVTDSTRCAHTVINIATTGTSYGGGDDTIDNIPLGGTGFTLYGVPMTTIRVDSNGGFSSTLTDPSDFSNGCGLGGGLLGSGVRVLVYHDDLRANDIFHQYFALCPRPHDHDPTVGCNIIQWDSYHFGTLATDNWTMQAVLYEGGEDMVFVYSGDTRENGLSATVGYVNGDRSVGVEWGCNADGIVANDSSICTYEAAACP